MWKVEQIIENAKKEDKKAENLRFYLCLLKFSDVADDNKKYEEAKEKLRNILEVGYDG